MNLTEVHKLFAGILGCSFNLRPFTDEHGSPNAGRPSPVDRGRLSSLGAPNAAYGCHWIWRRWKKRSFKVATSGSTAVCLTISTSAFPRTPVNHSECFARWCCWPQKMCMNFILKKNVGKIWKLLLSSCINLIWRKKGKCTGIIKNINLKILFF